MTPPEPYLSVVVTSRNDNHGGTMLRRMQTFVNALVGQCRRHRLDAELIVVEWNPPADRPPLADALRWPADLGPCQVRFVQVPPDVHARFRHSAHLPLFQMIAKNVGVRRARGRFVLCTNIDILFNDELAAFLAAGRLEPGRMYRLDRHDVMTDVPVDAPVEEQLAFCASHLLRVNSRFATVRLTPDGRVSPEPNDVLRAEDGLELGAGWYPLDAREGDPNRWASTGCRLIVEPPPGPPRPLRLDLGPGPAVRWGPFDLEAYDDAGALLARGRVSGGRQTVELRLPLTPGRRQGVRLVVPGGGRACPDGWVRSFRLYRACWSDGGGWFDEADGFVNFAVQAQAPDPQVAPAGAGVRLSHGWLPLHTWEGQPMHWAAERCGVVVRAPDGPPRPLRLRLDAGPGTRFGSFGLEVSDDRGRVVARGGVQGCQDVDLVLPLAPGATAAFRLRVLGPARPCADGAVRAYRLRRAGWAPAGARGLIIGRGWLNFSVSEPHVDPVHRRIAPASVGLGAGWLPFRWQGEPVCWAGPGALLRLRPPRGRPRPLRLMVESGPGVGGGPFGLEVRDDKGRLVAHGQVPSGDLHWVELRLPLTPGRVSWFRLDAVGGGRTTEGDGQPRDFRLHRAEWAVARSPAADGLPSWRNFSLEAAAPAPEAGGDAAGLRLGVGWAPLHYWQAHPMHWAGPDAHVVVKAPHSGLKRLRLVLEAGPGTDFGPFDLEVLDRHGVAVARAAVHGQTELDVDVPLRPGRVGRYRLVVRGPCTPGPDGQTQAYRLVWAGWPDDRPRLWRVFRKAVGRLHRLVFGKGWGSHKLRLGPIPDEPAPALDDAPGGWAALPGAATADAGPAPLDLTEAAPGWPLPLHTNACGDFTLMSRADWFDLRANPEMHYFSLHIDSLMCHIAHHAGVRETVLEEPLRIYHIEHSTGSGWTPEGEATLTARIRSRGIPMFDYEEVRRWCIDMATLRCPLIFNGPGWGLADEELPETTVRGRGAERAAA
jgi:hypothetical protein